MQHATLQRAESDPASRNIDHGHHAAHRVCVVVRTHSVQADVLSITLLSLTHQSYEGADVETSIFVVNTDAKGYSESDFMHAAAADANGKAGRKVVSVLDASFHRKPPREGFFGYDVTDHVLEHLLYGDSGCTHFLFTNGDNTYLRSFIERITPAILEGKQLIAWDFLTHHKCGRKCDKDSNVIKVDFVRKHLDLGSVVVGRRAIEMQKPPARFLDRRSETIELFTRDFYFFKRIYDHIGKENVSIIHQVLFVHQ